MKRFLLVCLISLSLFSENKAVQLEEWLMPILIGKKMSLGDEISDLLSQKANIIVTKTLDNLWDKMKDKSYEIIYDALNKIVEAFQEKETKGLKGKIFNIISETIIKILDQLRYKNDEIKNQLYIFISKKLKTLPEQFQDIESKNLAKMIQQKFELVKTIPVELRLVTDFKLTKTERQEKEKIRQMRLNDWYRNHSKLLKSIIQDLINLQKKQTNILADDIIKLIEISLPQS